MPMQITDESAHRWAFHEVHGRETLDPGCCFAVLSGCRRADSSVSLPSRGVVS